MPTNWNVRVIRGNPKYENGYLAFLDVLGFKNLMKTRAVESPRYIVKLFEKIDAAIQHPKVSGLIQRYISDSILIWCTHPASVPYMIHVCHELQDQLLLEGCLVRGVIVSGQHYAANFDQLNLATGERNKKSGEILVSPALVKAYNVEAQTREPVIKIEGAVKNDVAKLLKNAPRFRHREKKGFVSRKYYELAGYLMSVRFSVLRAGLAIAGRPDRGWQKAPDVKNAVSEVAQIRGRILEGLKNRDPKILRKWRYAKKMFNLRVKPMAKKWDLMRGMPI